MRRPLNPSIVAPHHASDVLWVKRVRSVWHHLTGAQRRAAHRLRGWMWLRVAGAPTVELDGDRLVLTWEVE